MSDQFRQVLDSSGHALPEKKIVSKLTLASMLCVRELKGEKNLEEFGEV